MEAIRNDWSDKGRKGWINYKRAARLGKDISVYQLINPTPGLVAQITDVTKNTGKRSVYLQKTGIFEETIEGKKSYYKHIGLMVSG